MAFAVPVRRVGERREQRLERRRVVALAGDGAPAVEVVADDELGGVGEVAVRDDCRLVAHLVQRPGERHGRSHPVLVAGTALAERLRRVRDGERVGAGGRESSEAATAPGCEAGRGDEQGSSSHATGFGRVPQEPRRWVKRRLG